MHLLYNSGFNGESAAPHGSPRQACYHSHRAAGRQLTACTVSVQLCQAVVLEQGLAHVLAQLLLSNHKRELTAVSSAA